MSVEGYYERSAREQEVDAMVAELIAAFGTKRFTRLAFLKLLTSAAIACDASLCSEVSADRAMVRLREAVAAVQS